MNEQEIRSILGNRVNAIDHVAGSEWCVWRNGAGHPVWSLDDVLELRRAFDADDAR